MNKEHGLTVNDILDAIYNALGHEVRRKIIEILAIAPQPYKTILKEVGVKDSSTLNYHLSKMKLLVEKDEKGLYRLTRIGKLALEVNKLTRGRVELLLPYIKGSKPTIILKPDVASLTKYLAILLALTVTMLFFIYMNIDLIIAIPLSTVIALPVIIHIAKTARKIAITYILKDGVIIEKVNMLFYSRNKYITGSIIDVSLSENLLSKILNCINVTLTIKCNGSILTLNIPYISRDSNVIQELIYQTM